MDDLDLVIDGTSVQVHFTEGGKAVFSFPQETNVKVTVDPADTAQPVGLTPDRLGAAILNALRSAGVIRERPTNPQHPDARQVDPIQGYASN